MQKSADVQGLEPDDNQLQADRFEEHVRMLARRGDMDLAMEHAESAVSQFASAANKKGQAIALLLLGIIYQHRGGSPAAHECFKQSGDLWEQVGNDKQSALAWQQAGQTFKYQADNEEVLKYLHRSIELFHKIDDRDGEMQSRLILALLYKKRGDIAASMELLHQCLAYHEQVGNKREAALALFNIANNYNVLEKPEEAIRFALRGLPDMEALCIPDDRALCLSILGTAYVKNRQYEVALEYFKRALTIAEERDSAWITVMALADIADALIHLKRYEQAYEALTRAISLRAEVNNPVVLGFLLTNLGGLYANPEFSGHDDTTAIPILLEARQFNEECNTPLLLVPTFAALTEVYERQEDYKQALTYHRLLSAMEKRLFNEESDRRLKHLELEKANQDAEIAHLRSVELAGALAEMKRLRDLAEENARTDALTGVANRRYLEERLQEESRRAFRYQRPLSVALMDADYFKHINDTFGHGVGDLVLRRLALLIRTFCRDGSGDLVARYGGEEFALLLPETPQEEALILCERLCKTVEATQWSDISTELERVTISIGLATAQAADNSFAGTEQIKKDVVEVLLSVADENLYKAKRDGRNRVIGRAMISLALTSER